MATNSKDSSANTKPAALAAILRASTDAHTDTINLSITPGRSNLTSLRARDALDPQARLQADRDQEFKDGIERGIREIDEAHENDVKAQQAALAAAGLGIGGNHAAKHAAEDSSMILARARSAEAERAKARDAERAKRDAEKGRQAEEDAKKARSEKEAAAEKERVASEREALAEKERVAAEKARKTATRNADAFDDIDSHRVSGEKPAVTREVSIAREASLASSEGAVVSRASVPAEAPNVTSKVVMQSPVEPVAVEAPRFADTGPKFAADTGPKFADTGAKFAQVDARFADTGAKFAETGPKFASAAEVAPHVTAAEAKIAKGGDPALIEKRVATAIESRAAAVAEGRVAGRAASQVRGVGGILGFFALPAAIGLGSALWKGQSPVEGAGQGVFPQEARDRDKKGDFGGALGIVLGTDLLDSVAFPKPKAIIVDPEQMERDKINLAAASADPYARLMKLEPK